MATPSKSVTTLIARGTSRAAFTQLTGCSVTRSGTTATLTKTSHGLSNGDTVLIEAFDLEEFNGVFTIGNVTSNTFDYTIAQDPGANPGGTPGKVTRGTLSTILDMSTKFSATIAGAIQNGSAPGLGAQVWLGLAGSNSEPAFQWEKILTAGIVANALYPFRQAGLRDVSHVALWVGGNTTNAVDVQAVALHTNSVS